MSEHSTAEIPRFHIDTVQPGVVRGGWFDPMGGMLVGVHAEKLCAMLNEHPELKETIAALEAEKVERAEYLRHSRTCWAKEPDMMKTCTCGLDELLSKEKKS